MIAPVEVDDIGRVKMVIKALAEGVDRLRRGCQYDLAVYRKLYDGRD